MTSAQFNITIENQKVSMVTTILNALEINFQPDRDMTFISESRHEDNFFNGADAQETLHKLNYYLAQNDFGQPISVNFSGMTLEEMYDYLTLINIRVSWQDAGSAKEVAEIEARAWTEFAQQHPRILGKNNWLLMDQIIRELESRHLLPQIGQAPNAKSNLTHAIKLATKNLCPDRGPDELWLDTATDNLSKIARPQTSRRDIETSLIQIAVFTPYGYQATPPHDPHTTVPRPEYNSPEHSDKLAAAIANNLTRNTRSRGGIPNRDNLTHAIEQAISAPLPPAADPQPAWTDKILQNVKATGLVHPTVADDQIVQALQESFRYAVYARD